MAGNFRWHQVEEQLPQTQLFNPDESTPFEQRKGVGKFEGIEFLHVHAKKIINEVPGNSPMPFRFTINAYRGCSHACVYCLSEDTEVSMADGTSKWIVDVQKGDTVLGTELVGTHRRYVPTEVKDQWQTFKRAYRTTLSDGTELTSSGDHRFLSYNGWKFVKQLKADDCLIRVGSTPLLVTNVEGLNTEMPMYDITTGTGDFVANGVVSHNCFARPTHAYLDLDIGKDFETKIVVKVNAAEKLRAELRHKNWTGDLIAMGTNTDPYQRAEGKYQLTRRIIQELSEVSNPFSILTKGTLVTRDIDLLIEANKRTHVSVNFSIPTVDTEVWRSTEPGTPNPLRRIDALNKLTDAGIECGVLMAPIIPGLSDTSEQMNEVLDRCKAAGASWVTPSALHLKPGVKEHWMSWLMQAYPKLVPKYKAMYAGKTYLDAETKAKVTKGARLNKT